MLLLIPVTRCTPSVKNKLGEYGETAKAWSSDDAKGFIKVSSTALRAYYLAHPDEER